MIKKEKIAELIDLMKSQGVAELQVKSKEEEVCIKFQAGGVAPLVAAAPVLPPPPVMPQTSGANAAAGAPSDALQPGQRYILSPFVGTFYEAPSPGAEVFAKEGQSVSKGQVLCIVEAMKLMNEIEAEVSGTIKKILVKNEQPVEFEQPLFILSLIHI